MAAIEVSHLRVLRDIYYIADTATETQALHRTPARLHARSTRHQAIATPILASPLACLAYLAAVVAGSLRCVERGTG